MTPSASVLAGFDRACNKDLSTNNSWIDQYKLVVDRSGNNLNISIKRDVNLSVTIGHLCRQLYYMHAKCVQNLKIENKDSYQVTVTR